MEKDKNLITTDTEKENYYNLASLSFFAFFILSGLLVGVPMLISGDYRLGSFAWARIEDGKCYLGSGEVPLWAYAASSLFKTAWTLGLIYCVLLCSIQKYKKTTFVDKHLIPLSISVIVIAYVPLVCIFIYKMNIYLIARANSI